MSVSSAQSEVRSALAAYVEGATPLTVFEQSVARLLASRVSARGEVHSELQAAVADGTLPPESLRRLGLTDPPAPNTPATPDFDAGRAEGRRRGANASRRPEAGAEGDSRPARASAKSRNRRPAPAAFNTGSEWLESKNTTPQEVGFGSLLGNRYRLDRVLGEGGMGVVYLAVDEEVRGELFAVKVLRPEIRNNPESLRLLREEVRRTRALRHPNIVGVYSLNSDPSGVYMLMEYLDGKSLKALLDEEFGRGMPLIRAWPLIYDIGAALAYAHDHNVIHSDIKPSNVFITIAGSCKLLDFGIARADRNRTTLRDPTTMGALTPAYASCEMFEGRAPDQSDDVYAFACLIYEMLTGKHPYGRVNAFDARTQKLQPAPIKGLTNRQNQALARALEFDRARRTVSVEILLEGLKGIVDTRPQRLAWIAAIAVAVGVTVVTGIYLQRTRSTAIVPQPEAPVAALEEPNPDRAERAPPAATGATTPPPAKVKAAKPPAATTTATGAMARLEPKHDNDAVANSPSGNAMAPLGKPAAAKVAVPVAAPVKHAGLEDFIPSGTGAVASVSGDTKAASPPVAATPDKVAPAADKAAEPPAEKVNAPTVVAALPAAPAAHAVAGPIPVVQSFGAAPSAASDAPSAPSDAPSAVSGAPSGAAAPPPAAVPVHLTESERPPFGKHVPAVVATPDSRTKMQSEENCPYPAEARNQMQTGTVILLVYVSPDGSAANAQVDGDGSSGSAVLDQAAIKCVRDVGRFPAKPGTKQGYWARTRFVWSFGD